MKNLTAVIIEDEKVSREIIKDYLSSYCKGVEFLGEASNIDDGEKLIHSKDPDIVFLDIEMPFGNGFDLLERFDSVRFEVVFITAYSNYAIKALNISASYYILKPIDIDELVQAVEKIKKNIENPEDSITKVLIDNIKASKTEDKKIVLSQLDGFEVVEIKSIIRIEASDNYSIIFVEGNKKYVMSKTLKYYEELLSEFDFLRSHKSHVVNLAHVVKYKKGKVGQAILSDGSSVLVTSGAKKKLMNYFI